MTRERMFGSDTEFCAWMRSCRELPAFSNDCGFVASDNDLTVHRYKTVVDNIGSRDVQAMMHVEVKTRNGSPSTSQLDTLSKLNLFSGERNIDGQHIRFFGVFILRMTGTSPDDSDHMGWGVIPKNRNVKSINEMVWTPVDKDRLIALLRFDLHPATFEKQAFRRHHKTQVIYSQETMPLGFKIMRPTIKRS